MFSGLNGSGSFVLKLCYENCCVIFVYAPLFKGLKHRWFVSKFLGCVVVFSFVLEVVVEVFL